MILYLMTFARELAGYLWISPGKEQGQRMPNIAATSTQPALHFLTEDLIIGLFWSRFVETTTQKRQERSTVPELRHPSGAIYKLVVLYMYLWASNLIIHARFFWNMTVSPFWTTDNCTLYHDRNHLSFSFSSNAETNTHCLVHSSADIVLLGRTVWQVGWFAFCRLWLYRCRRCVFLFFFLV